MVKIYIITGETSGEQLAFSILEKLNHQSILLRNNETTIKGVWSNEFQKALTFSNIDAQQACSNDFLSIMGFSNVIRHFFKIKKERDKILKDILSFNPDIILTFDAPDFNYNILKKLKKTYQKNNIQKPMFYHFVAPTVWAWRPWRAKYWAKVLDHIFCLFPFEPAYFIKEGLQATFIGHPLVKEYHSSEFQHIKTSKFSDSKNAYDFAFLLGSRNKEIEFHLPFFKSLYKHIKKDPAHLNSKIVIPTFEKYLIILQQNFPDAIFETNLCERRKALCNSKKAIVVSGTATLDCALSYTPMIVVYKTDRLSAWIAKKLVNLQHFALPNILSAQKIIPELIQEKLTLENCVQALKNIDMQDLNHFKSLEESLNHEINLDSFPEFFISKSKYLKFSGNGHTE